MTSRRWSLVLTALLAALLLVLAFRGTSWEALVATLRQGRADSLLLTFGVISVSYFVRGLRWGVLIGAQRRVGPLTMYWATSVGYLANPLRRARAGEVIRSVMIARKTGLSVSYVFATALTERMMDVVALVLISLVSLLMLDLPPWLITAVQVFGAVSVAGLVVLVVLPRLEPLLLRVLCWLPLPASLAARLEHLLEQFLLGLRVLHHPGRAARFAGFTLLIWLLDGVSAITTAMSLALWLSLPQAMLLLAGLGLSSAVPSTPVYVGIYQFVAVTILPRFDFSRSEALAYILTFQALCLLVVVVWGMIGIWQLGLTRAENRDVLHHPHAARDSSDSEPPTDA